MALILDPYERQLFDVFNTYDQDQTGHLDRHGLLQLCSTLQLGDCTSRLAQLLITDEKTRVTFDEFKEAFLRVLKEHETSTNDDEKSPEVKPKYVHNFKRYGRRSRSCLGDFTDDPKDSTKVQRSHPLKKQRTNEKNEAVIDDKIEQIDHIHDLWQQLDASNSGFLTRNELKMICEYAGLTEIADDLIRDMFAKQNVDRVDFRTFARYFKNIAREPNHSANASTKLISLGIDASGTMSADAICEMWENAGIQAPNNLLRDIGFQNNQINVVHLASVLNQELRDLQSDLTAIDSLTQPHLALLTATLALYQNEVRCLKAIVEQMDAERDKLKADLNDANDRATLLAVEIDESHATIEKSMRDRVKVMEQRHSDMIRDLIKEFNGEKEQASNVNKKLMRKIQKLEEAESKLKLELASLQTEHSTCEEENATLQEQMRRLNETNNELAVSVARLEIEKSTIAETASKRCDGEIVTYLKQIDSLQSENTLLRDRNDELQVELEALSGKINRMHVSGEAPSHVDLSLMSNSSLLSVGSNMLDDPKASFAEEFECDYLDLSMRASVKFDKCTQTATDPAWLRAQIEQLRAILNECTDDNQTKSSSRNDEAVVDCEIDDDKSNENNALEMTQLTCLERTKDVQTMTEAICDVNDSINYKHEYEKLLDERNVLREQCSEMEQALELLREEYNNCENYWWKKIDEERLLFEQEQNKTNANFQELLSKMAALEDQIVDAPGLQSDEPNAKRLPTIDENMLERQFYDLEQEFDVYKKQADETIDEQLREMTSLKSKITELQITKQTLNVDTQTDECDETVSLDETSTKNTTSGVHTLSDSSCSSFEPPRKWYSSRNKKYSGASYKRDEIAKLKQLKNQLNDDCQHLSRTRCDLQRDILRISRNWHGNEPYYRCRGYHTGHGTSSDPNSPRDYYRVSAIAMQDYNVRLQNLGQKCRNLSQSLRKQQHQAESVLQQCWMQHHDEVNDLKSLLQSTQRQLEQQKQFTNEKLTQLSNADVMLKDLYVENSYLIAAVRRLEYQLLLAAKKGNVAETSGSCSM